MRPAHLVLDEPTAQLDPAGTRLVADAIERLAADGPRSWSPSRRPICWPHLLARRRSSTAGHVALVGPAAEVLGRSAAGGARRDASRRPVRLRRAAEAAGDRDRAPVRGPGSMAELRVEGLVHVYAEGGVRALDGVDLTIGAGERVALIGQNGSGKTTLVRHLNGLLRPTEGRVMVDGRRCGHAHRRAAGARGSASSSRTRTGRSSRGPCAPRWSSGRATWADADPRCARPCRTRSRPPGSPVTKARTRTTSAGRVASCSRWHRSWPCGRRCSCSTSRRPGRTRAASSASARSSRRLRARADGHRHQPRHALRGRDLRPRRRHARRPRHPRRDTGRGLRGGCLGGAALDVPRAAAGRGARRSARRRLDADRREPDRRAQAG